MKYAADELVVWDLYAAQALSAYITISQHEDVSDDDLAKRAASHADRLLEQRCARKRAAWRNVLDEVADE